MKHSHLQRIESAPGNAHHPHVAVRPWLPGEPGNYLQTVSLLLFGIFAVGRNSLAGAETANIDTSADVAAASEVSVDSVVASGHGVIFSVGLVFEDGREFLIWLHTVRHVQSDGKAQAVFHGDPSVFHADSVDGGRWRNGGEAGESAGGSEQECKRNPLAHVLITRSRKGFPTMDFVG